VPRVARQENVPARSLRQGLALLATLLAVAACGKETVPFRLGLDPLEKVDEVAWPSPTAGEAYPETVSVVDARGRDTFGGAAGANGAPPYSYAHGRAYLSVPVAEVWQAMQAPQGAYVENYSSRNDVDCEAVPGVLPEYPLSMLLKKTPKNNGSLGRQYWFKVTWAGGTLPGAAQPPEQYNFAYQKTDGTSLIQVMEGSIVARRVTAGVTSLEIVRHINAPTEDGSSARDWIVEFYTALKEQVHGQPAPKSCAVAGFP
jgi:hypothetical protein